jgi:hypothetical protein
MEIGETVTYNGRSYVLLGLEPMSVPDRKAELRDQETGEVVSVACSLLAQTGEGLGREA